MELSIPTYIKVVKGGQSGKTAYRASSLFLPEFASENIVLQRALAKLTRELGKTFSNFGKDWQQRKLVNCAFNPAGLRQTNVKFEFEFQSRHWRCKYFLATFPAFDRQIAFCPELPSVWFEYQPGHLQQRATEVYQQYFRNQRKRTPSNEEIIPTAFNAESKRWLTWVDARVTIDQLSKKDHAKKLMALWTNQSVSGEAALDQVGRNLDWQFPDDLDRAYLRDQEAEKLKWLMELPDRRPVMLIGDPLVGKTSLIHEVVARRVEQRLLRGETTVNNVDKARNNVWLLSPQRLISGMSHVGQWEQQVHAILKRAQKKDLTLYFDDPIGLFQAGKSSCSNLCVADLLRKSLRDRNVRVLCELTNDGFERLINIDRSFADLFHVFRIEPLVERETLRVGVHVSRRIEHEHKVDFAPEVLPTVVQLQRQYVGHACFPGKAVRFLKQLGSRYSGTIRREDVIREMADTCGIGLPMIDDSQTLSRERVQHQFERMIVGQAAAVATCVDLVMTQKAQLSAPGKPLMTMLFTGPTGVGKTETAKALANYLFADQEKLVRFDLNEFKTPYSAARLIGTLDQPEGLLTSAIRHRPYRVILFDEIEKAHPDVFDILLQVLGEGRLTDALGRTTDFSNTIIVMTSNLGAKRASNMLGFVPSDDQRHYIAAAEKFFRPEFFNRIDRVVPFHSLSRSQVGKIAERLMKGVVSREGLTRRRVVLDVGPDLISDIVDVGYDESMGARGLKRAIEQHFTHPVAAELTCLSQNTPTRITVRKNTETANSGAPRLIVNVLTLKNAATIPQPRFDSDQQLYDAAERFLERIEAESFAERPPGEITGSGMSAELLRYFSLVESANEIRETMSILKNRIESTKPSAPPVIPISQGRRQSVKTNSNTDPGKTFSRDLSAVSEIQNYVSHASSAEGDTGDPLHATLIGQCRMISAEAASQDSEAIVYIIPSDPEAFLPHNDGTQRYEPNANSLEEFLRQSDYEVLSCDLKVDHKYCRCLHIAGCGVMATIGQERGFFLSKYSSGQLDLFEVGFLTSSQDAYDQIRDAIRAAQDEPKEYHFSRDQFPTDNQLPVLRIINNQHTIVEDFRSGRQAIPLTDLKQMNAMRQAGLPVPPEFDFGESS